MKQLYIFAALLLCFSSFASKATPLSDTTQVLPFAEKMPAFPGGDSAMFAYISNFIEIPEKVKQDGATGTVYARFTVTNNGNIRDAEIVKSLHPNLDNEVLRVVTTMPEWTPGEQNGKKVHVKYVLPIKFEIRKPTENINTGVELLFMRDPEDPNNKIFLTVQKLPEYPNGVQKMFDFLALRITSQTNLFEGEAHIKMIVRKDGSLTNLQVIQSTDPSFEADVLRAIKRMPKWNPAEVNGEKVDSYYDLYYRLEPKFNNREKKNIMRRINGY